MVGQKAKLDCKSFFADINERFCPVALLCQGLEHAIRPCFPAMLPNLQNREEAVVLLTIFRTAPAWITAAECYVFRTLLAVEQRSVRPSKFMREVIIEDLGDDINSVSEKYVFRKHYSTHGSLTSYSCKYIVMLLARVL